MQTLQAAPILFEIIVLIFSIIIHEISHGYVAELLGDPTARLQGRLTLNPLKHIDPIGSIVVPILTLLSGYGSIFGWAKPVPYNPYNLKHRRSGELLVAFAGPFSNFLIAFVFALFIRFGLSSGIITSVVFFQLCVYVVLINISLAVFNLIPFPPLDGSKIIFVFFPSTPKWMRIRQVIEQYSIFLVLILVVFLWGFVSPVIPFIFQLFTGISLY